MRGSRHAAVELGILENCTLNVFPFGNTYASIARQVSRGDTGRRDVLKLGNVN